MSSISNLAVRAVQIVFAAIVAGLSIDLARGHKDGAVPIALGYVSFVGCVSLLAAFIGLAATWIEFLQGPIGLLVDGFITVVNLAGGVLIAAKLKGVKCDKNSSDVTNALKIIENELINGGKHGKGLRDCYYCTGTESDADKLISRCKMNQADTAFMFLTVVVLLVSLTLTYLRAKKGY
jgi:hypothetical protein